MQFLHCVELKAIKQLSVRRRLLGQLGLLLLVGGTSKVSKKPESCKRGKSSCGVVQSCESAQVSLSGDHHGGRELKCLSWKGPTMII